MTPSEIVEQVKQAIQDKYAWPGGYPLYLIMADGEPMSIDAAKENLAAIEEATMIGQPHDNWAAAGVDINWEEPLICCHSGKPIESAYGEE
jgi:hypothetical protein